jgi:hypothetical protein
MTNRRREKKEKVKSATSAKWSLKKAESTAAGSRDRGTAPGEFPPNGSPGT